MRNKQVVLEKNCESLSLTLPINGNWEILNNSTSYFLKCDPGYIMSGDWKTASCVQNQWIYNGTAQCLRQTGILVCIIAAFDQVMFF